MNNTVKFARNELGISSSLSLQTVVCYTQENAKLVWSGVGLFETAVAFLNKVVAYYFFGNKSKKRGKNKAGLFPILFGLITF